MRIKPHLSIIHRITHESGISSDSGVSFSPSSATASASSSSERKETAPISLAPERRTDSPVPTLEVDDEQEAWADVLRSVRPIGDCLRTRECSGARLKKI